MKRFLLLIFIAIATFLLFAFFKNPDVLDDIWLWLVGFAGLILQLGKKVVDFIKSLTDKPQDVGAVAEPTVAGSKKTPQNPLILDPSVVHITLLRFHDDTQTTLGLLYINNRFYCYTLEDAYHEIKIPKETRIPAGTYPVDFRKTVTDLTKTYRLRYPDWFKYHIQIHDVPGFSAIYIHNGGDHTNTDGCILVSDSLNVGNEKTYLSNSKNTFKTFYQFVEAQLLANKKISITIKDETWIGQLPI